MKYLKMAGAVFIIALLMILPGFVLFIVGDIVNTLTEEAKKESAR